MSKRVIVGIVVVVALVAVAGAMWQSDGAGKGRTASALLPQEQALVRAHSPVLGPVSAPVTVVEFIDPGCGTCREFHPLLKGIMSEFTGQVRLVLRYAPFHEGAEEVVRILETARRQGVFEPVLEAVLEAQPEWSDHDAPDVAKAWQAAHAAGLDLEKAREDMMLSEITAVLNQDKADVEALAVRKTPTFYVNGRPLPSFGFQQLYDLVASEVRAADG